jgi:hypothetical protein
MLRVLSTVCGLSALLAAGLLGGCSPLDVYAFRAVQYNFEAEETQNQVILLNIVRSSLHRPLEFTEITNIVGGNSANGTTSFSFPVGFRLPTGVTTGTAGGSIGGSTTFTIPVLDTQDFYEGLLTDIQPSLLGYYFISPFVPKDLVFNLFVERVVVHVTGCAATDHSSRCERDFRNNPDSLEDIALFQTFAAYLESLGLSVEQVASANTNNKSQIIISGNTTINITSGSTGNNAGTSAGGVSSESSAGSGGATTKTPSYRLCFSPRGPVTLPAPMFCGYVAPKKRPGKKPPPFGNAEADVAAEAQTEIAPNTRLVGIPFSKNLADEMLTEIRKLGGDPFQYKDSLIHFSGIRFQLPFNSARLVQYSISSVSS